MSIVATEKILMVKEDFILTTFFWVFYRVFKSAMRLQEQSLILQVLG
jgi:hypothetical protein